MVVPKLPTSVGSFIRSFPPRKLPKWFSPLLGLRQELRNSPAGGGPAPKPKAGAKAKAAGGKNPSYCFKFAKPGGCNDTNCAFMHLDEAMIKEFERAGKVRKDNANAKP